MMTKRWLWLAALVALAGCGGHLNVQADFSILGGLDKRPASTTESKTTTAGAGGEAAGK